MTVIAYKNGVIASDTLITAGRMKTGCWPKIVANRNGDIAGASGEAAWLAAILDWFQRGQKGSPPIVKVDDNNVLGTLIYIKRDDPCVVWERFSDSLLPERSYRFLPDVGGYAIGSGSLVAMGAMHAGADAVGAVKTAIALDVNCGGDVVSLSLPKIKVGKK